MRRNKRAFQWKDRPTNDVSGPECGEEGRLDIGKETRAVDRAVEKPWGVDAVVAQGGKEGHRLPMAVRDAGREPRSPRRSSPQRRHVGLGPCFIDEDQAGRIDPALILGPLRAPSRDVGTIPLAGHDGFF